MNEDRSREDKVMKVKPWTEFTSEEKDALLEQLIFMFLDEDIIKEILTDIYDKHHYK